MELVGCYSYFRVSAGFFVAVRMASKLTVSNAIVVNSNPANININNEMLT